MTLQRIITHIAIVISGLVLIMGLCVFALQLFQPAKTNPPVVSEPPWDSAQTRDLMERACFDCHSNETKWPPYSNIAPISWSVAREVRTGRKKVNYSEWKPNQENEAVETILEGEMPPKPYLLLHPEARLTKAETEALINGLRATFGNHHEEDEDD